MRAFVYVFLCVAYRAEYKDALDKLQPPMPAPRKCQSYHCDARPMCYTNFEPHYSKNMTLSELVVGNTTWEYDAAELGDWSIHYGYLDAKPLYQAKGPVGDINLKIRVGNADYIWICGASKESLLHATVYLDPNYHSDFDATQDYVPTANRVEWTKKKYVGSECKSIIGLPVGQHILSISPNPSHPDHITSLSHVIMWP
jgi:hypothetical protein